MLIVSFEEFQTTSENLLLIVNHLNESDKESQKITKNHHQFFIKKNKKTIQWPSFNVLENRAGFERATKEEVSRRASKKSSQNQTMPQKKTDKNPEKILQQMQRTRKEAHKYLYHLSIIAIGLGPRTHKPEEPTKNPQKNPSNVQPRVHKPKELEKEAHKTWIRLQKSQPSFSNCNRGPTNLKNPARIPKNPPKKNHWNDQKMSWLRIW